MEMDRGRAYPQRLGELAQAEPVWADALDQLGGGGDDRSLRQAGAGSGLPFLLNNWTRGLLFGIVMMATMTLAMSRERGGSQANQ